MLVGCSKKETDTATESPIIKKATSITSPSINQSVVLGEAVNFTVEADNFEIDSVVMLVGKESTKFDSGAFTWTPETEKTGTFKFQAKVYFNGNEEVHYPRLKMLSDITPEKFGYVSLGSYPHDETAFTQGLFFHNNILYESTGQEGQSTIRKVDLVTGNVISSTPLGDDYFGEGCTLYNDEIYQVTWMSNTGFVYDTELNLKRSFPFNFQGWGLTSMGDSLVLTQGNDTKGSEVIYFMNPGDFSEIGRIEVYNDKGPVSNLNELEYINGEIYANEWQTDNIHVIEPRTGRVLKTIDLSGLLSESEQKSADVLNGIAYDTEGDRLFVTGKYWPKLFEIKLQPKD